MKKKRKFSDGGKFELSPEALAAGLSMGRNTSIRPEDREAAIAETTGPGSKGFKRLSDKEAADLMEREVNMPEAVAIPVPRPRALAGRELPAPSRSNQNDYSMNEMEGSGRGSEPAPRARAGATPRPVPAQNPTLPNATPRVRNVPSSPDTSPGMTARPSESMRLRREKERLRRERPLEAMPMKKGGAVKAKRGDGIAQRGKTKGRFV